MTVRNDRFTSRPRLLPRTGCCGRSLALIAAAAFAAPLSSAWADAHEAGAAPVTDELDTIVITARRRTENVQDVPIAVSVIGRDDLARQGTYTIQQVSQQAPTLQYTSSNPRNTAVTIRGLGVSFGLANDGLEQGVGFYVDQVYNSRPAAAAFDLIDIERVEVLRGPQGTLFGKNTTAGALNITTRLPTFAPEGLFEGSVGTHGFLQTKASISGPLSDTLAGRLTVGKSVRDGYVFSTATGRNVNDQDNLGLRGQLLWKPTDNFSLRASGDYAVSDADCCTQVYFGVGQSLRAANRQYPFLAAALNYSPPSTNPYDRIADVNAKLQAYSEIGGFSLIGDYDFGPATLTSISAWRWWNWKPANDRDYTRLDILRQSANSVQQDQWSQELRVASNGSHLIDYTAGLYGFYQTLHGQNVTEWGNDAALWLIGSTVPSNLLSGFTSRSAAVSTIRSYAAFSQANWNISDTWQLTPGLRYTRETKTADYSATVSGGLSPVTAAQRNSQLSIARPQAYVVDFTDSKLTGDVSLSWKPRQGWLVYGSYAHGFKSGGINLAGLPLNTANNPALDRAVVSPEKSVNYELGLKTELLDRRVAANVALFRADVHDFQANVVDSGPGALRGYLANIDKVRSQGVEFDLTLTPVDGFSGYVRGAYTDATYVSFPNAPCPLERQVSSTSVCNLSGVQLPGSSKWAGSVGGEYRRGTLHDGDAYVGLDATYRSRYFADASASKYLVISDYTVVNLRVGFASHAGWEVFGLVRNLFDKDYMQLLTPQSGNSGLVSGLPGDPRSYQVTVRYSFGP
jgi:iron complex outermembrane receptor protein